MKSLVSQFETTHEGLVWMLLSGGLLQLFLLPHPPRPPHLPATDCSRTLSSHHCAQQLPEKNNRGKIRKKVVTLQMSFFQKHQTHWHAVYNILHVKKNGTRGKAIQNKCLRYKTNAKKRKKVSQTKCE